VTPRIYSLRRPNPVKKGAVSISFEKSLLRQIDEMAREESRSRSELIREAARIYIERKKRWKDIFAFGEKQVRRLRLTEIDVESERGPTGGRRGTNECA
jgi:CopG family transcriptional regulator / antitoxin EndoAI